MINENSLNNRDISWLYFNERVLLESRREYVPLLEKLKFLAIYSSNLDEFYRVRIPILHSWNRLYKKRKFVSNPDLIKLSIYSKVKETIKLQQQLFGHILTDEIIPSLEKHYIIIHYNKELPDLAIEKLREFFFVDIACFLSILKVSEESDFFPTNNELYLFISSENTERYIINIPSFKINRFKIVTHNGKQYVFFIDDIIKYFIKDLKLFTYNIKCYSFKITRNAELDINEEVGEELVNTLLKELKKRNYGIATRLLYESGMSNEELEILLVFLNLKKSTSMKGGRYHNLKDFFNFPIKDSELKYSSTAYINSPYHSELNTTDIFEILNENEILLHAPYQSYNNVIRFFNEAALDASVHSIYVTLYRLALDSKIGHALLNAALNGKIVYVFVELKARFDEYNNIKWAQRLKEAGVHISYSFPNIKVHAKVALVKRINNNTTKYYGLLSTGNLNENTAKIYTDHTLLTSDDNLLLELASLFKTLTGNEENVLNNELTFNNLLVSQYNLYPKFLALIDNEILASQDGKEAFIRIKLNNLEEEKLIEKLYEASNAGVRIQLIIRGICRIKPNIIGLSENIEIKRIVGRYLEHSRIFHFCNSGDDLIFIGSSDWMIRNIHHRIEVCFPIKNLKYKNELIEYINIQLSDDVSATKINENGDNIPYKVDKNINAQVEIRKLLFNKYS